MNGLSGAVDHTFNASVEGGDAGAFQFVKNLVTTFFAGEDTGVSQHGEVPRYGGHVGVDCFIQITDTEFTLGQSVDNNEPGGVSQSLENIGSGL